MSLPPRRVLLLRPDTYGDLVLFEPVPRIIRNAWPDTEVAVLIRERYTDIVPLISSPGVHWLTTRCDPYHRAAADDPEALAALRETVRGYDPDCVVAACTEHTWLEAAVANFLPDVRRVAVTASPDAVGSYPETFEIARETPEWKKNLRVAGALLGKEAPRWWPSAHVPEDARASARQILADAGLEEGGFVACAAAGVANVQIKAWPTERYGEILAWLERERGVRALLIGHESERARLEAARAAAQGRGGEPALWTGRDGEMPTLGALLAAARFYFGNDTGAVHLAAALGRPVASIFGGGHWPRFRPVAAREVTVVQPMPCFGCAWECDFADAPCVQTITTESVQRALDEFLASETSVQTVYEAEGLDTIARAIVAAATPRLRFLRDDGAARLRQVGELSALLATSEADRTARLQQVGTLDTLLAERDREVKELTSLLTISEADRAARLRQVEELSTLLAASEADRNARLKNMENLERLLAASEADRAARLVSIEKLTAMIHATSAADADSQDRNG